MGIETTSEAWDQVRVTAASPTVRLYRNGRIKVADSVHRSLRNHLGFEGPAQDSGFFVLARRRISEAENWQKVCNLTRAIPGFFWKIRDGWRAIDSH
jgi:hypothetical protein